MKSPNVFYLKMHEYGAYIPGVFSLWIALLGYLALKSRFVPKIVGILMIIAGFAWVTQVVPLVSPGFDVTAFGVIGIAGEAVFYLWLLIRGVNVEKWEQQAQASAA